MRSQISMLDVFIKVEINVSGLEVSQVLEHFCASHSNER